MDILELLQLQKDIQKVQKKVKKGSNMTEDFSLKALV